MDTEKMMIEYCLGFENSYLDFPFHDGTIALRHSENKKTFLFLIHGKGKNKNETWANMKCDPIKAPEWTKCGYIKSGRRVVIRGATGGKLAKRNVLHRT